MHISFIGAIQVHDSFSWIFLNDNNNNNKEDEEEEVENK